MAVVGVLWFFIGIFTVSVAAEVMVYYDALVFEHGIKEAEKDPYWGMVILALIGVGFMWYGGKLIRKKIK